MRPSELLQNLLRVRPEEARRTLWSFLYLFTAVGAFITGRISRSTLFLELPGFREKLPLMYIIQAVAVSVAMILYARVERKLRRDQTNAISLALIITVTLVLRALLATQTYLVYATYYIWIELVGTFVIVQFWTFTNEIFNSRQAKRLFAVIGGGGVLSGVAAGFGIRATVDAIGTENLLFVMAASLSISLAMVIALGRNARSELNAALERGPSPKGHRTPAQAHTKVFATRHVQLIAVVVVLTYLVSTLVDYQFQVIVGDAITDKDARSAYFGTFFGATGVLAGIIQFGLTSRILERFGLLFGLIALPACMLLGSIGLLSVPLVVSGLWAVAFTKGSENTLRYSVNDTALQLLYLPVPSHIRGRAKAFIDGILKPSSIGGAGLLLALLKGTLEDLAGIDLGLHVSVYEVSWIVASGLTLWLLCLAFLRREYVKSLLQTLQRRRLNLADTHFSIHDEATVRTLHEALGSQTIGEVLHALELLRYATPKAREGLNSRVGELLDHESQDIRVAALNYLESSGSLPQAEQVARLLADPAPQVRAAATITYCAVQREKALGEVHPLLNDPDLHVRAAAVAGLVRYCGFDGVLAAAERLKGLLASDDPEERRQAAWVLGKVGVQNFYQPLLPLLNDDSERVRLAAIEAAGQLRSPELQQPLAEQLAHAPLAGAAVAALASFGEPARRLATDLLRDTSATPFVRVQATRILGRLLDADATAVLQEHLTDAEPSVRGRVVAALNYVVQHSPGVRLHASAIRAALRAETETYFQWLAIEQDLALSDDNASALLADAIAHRREQCLTRLFGLLALVYPSQTIDLVRRNLKSPQATTRANAVEVLDNILAKEEKRYILPALEDAPTARKLQSAADVFTLTRGSPSERLATLLSSGDAWMQACAAMAVGQWGIAVLEANVRELLDSTDAICRETAIVALSQFQDQTALRRAVEPLQHDPEPLVSRYAEFVLASA